MLLFGVLGLAFAGGETKAKSATVVQKEVKRTRQIIKRKIIKKNRSEQNNPSSHGNHMYTSSRSNTSNHDYCSTIVDCTIEFLIEYPIQVVVLQRAQGDYIIDILIHQ